MKRFYQDKTYIFFLIILLTVSYLRSPDIFNDGRFWGEDGSLYFQNAIKNSFFDNFFQIYTPTSGYYNLFPRIVALVSSSFALEVSALINVYLSFMPLIYIFFLIFYNDSYLFKNLTQRFLLSILVITCPTFVPEVWVNSVNAQIYLSVSALLILYAKNNNNLIFNSLNSTILLVGGLSSVYVFFLTPFFFIKYIIFKTKNNFINFSILLFSFIFQLFFYLYSKFTEQMIFRNYSLEYNLDYLKIFFYNTIAKLFFPKKILVFFISILNKNNFLNLLIILLLIFLIAYTVIGTIKLLKKNKSQLIITSSLALIFILLVLIIGIFSGESFAGRYSALPGFLVSLLIYNLCIQVNNNKIFKNYLIFLTLLIFMSGLYQYRPNDNYRIQYLDCINECVPWKTQVKKYQSNKLNVIKIWPYNKEDNLANFEYQNFIIID